jgi:hypothetical protein
MEIASALLFHAGIARQQSAAASTDGAEWHLLLPRG